jgi:hypothetical protein
MRSIGRWRQSATAIACTCPRAKRFRVPELRQARWHLDACEAEKENSASKETAEAEQAKSLAFSLSASLAFRSLSLVLFVGESIPCEAASGNLGAHNSETLRVRELASVVAKALLVEITEQVIGLNADIRSLKLPPHQAPEVLHRIRVNVAVCVLYSVIHNRVAILRGKPIVRLQGVAEQSATGLDILLHMLVEFVLSTVRDSESKDLAAALHHTKGDGFILTASACDGTFPAFAMHVAGFPADEGFVNLNLTGQLRSRLVLHSFADTVKHEPSGLLGQTKVSRDLVARNAILAVGNEPHGGEPLAQRDGRLIENRADLHRELLPAFRGAALPNSASLKEHRFLGRAVRALYAFGPALARKVVQSVVGIIEVNNRFGQCFGAFHA